MATINPTVNWNVHPADNSVVRVTWTPVTEADTCAAFQGPQFSDKTFQVFGTFGAGGSIAVHGSLDAGTTFAALDDPGGTVIAFAAAKIKTVLENVDFIKPAVTAGTGVSLTVVMLGRLSNTLRN